MKRKLALLMGLLMAGAMISGCSSSSDKKSKTHTNSASDNDLKSESGIGDDDNGEQTLNAPEANFHVGADFNNLINGGNDHENRKNLGFSSGNDYAQRSANGVCKYR